MNGKRQWNDVLREVCSTLDWTTFPALLINIQVGFESELRQGGGSRIKELYARYLLAYEYFDKGTSAAAADLYPSTADPTTPKSTPKKFASIAYMHIMLKCDIRERREQVAVAYLPEVHPHFRAVAESDLVLSGPTSEPSSAQRRSATDAS